MARGAHKWRVLRKHPTAKLKFSQGLGYYIEVDDRQLSRFQWSPVNAWSQADLQPLFPFIEPEKQVKIVISFEYDPVRKVARVLSSQPVPPFGLGTLVSVLHDSHFSEDAKKVLRRAVDAAIKGNLAAITAVKQV
jgi:hypothetical protein